MGTVFRKKPVHLRSETAADRHVTAEAVEVVYLLTCRQCSAEPFRFVSREERRDWSTGHFESTGHRLTEPLRMETADGRWYGGHIAIEPPMKVTRVRTLGGTTGWDKNSTMIRGAQCEFCGPGHSHWAYVPVGADSKPPSADSTLQDEGGWYCWLDLDSRGALVDDTENDHRVDKESVA